MKGFLIFMVIIVGGGLYLFTHTHELGLQAIADLKNEEGPEDANFTNMKYQTPDIFATKYRPFLERRATLCKWLPLAGESELMDQVARETKSRYDETLLSKDEAYGEILFRLAVHLEDGSIAQEAGDDFKRYNELFPNGKHVSESAAAIQRLIYRYNIK